MKNKTLTLTLLSLLGLFGSTAYAQQVFWTYQFASSGSYRVATTNFSGTNPYTDIITISNETRDLGVLQSASKIYVATPNAILYSDLDGGNLNSNFVTGLSNAYSIGIDSVNSRIYYSSSTGINRVDVTSGTSVSSTHISSEGAGSLGLAIDPSNQHIYYLDPGANALKRIDFDGGNVTTLTSGGTISDPNGIDIDLVNSRIYITNTTEDDINRFSLNGTHIDTVVNDDGIQGIFGVATAPHDNYIVYGKASGSAGNTRRADLDGSGQATIADYSFGSRTKQVAVIPEPSTYALIAGGIALIAAWVWRKRSST